MSETDRSNNNVYYSCHYHVVWCPKYRRKVLERGIDERLKQLIAEVCQQFDAQIEGLEIMPDHVHLLVSVDPQFGIHRLIRHIKGRSSRSLRQEYPSTRTRLPSLWTNSYFVATTGGAPKDLIPTDNDTACLACGSVSRSGSIDVIKHYIQEQKRV